MSDIYNMQLHSVMPIESSNMFTEIMRVPGGWIYRFFENNVYCGSIFVPFHNEFQSEGER